MCSSTQSRKQEFRSSRTFAPESVSRSTSAVTYWLLDWPVFLFHSALAWYLTVIGLIGAFLILMVVGILVAYWFGIRVGW